MVWLSLLAEQNFLGVLGNVYLDLGSGNEQVGCICPFVCGGISQQKAGAWLGITCNGANKLSTPAGLYWGCNVIIDLIGVAMLGQFWTEAEAPDIV